MPLAGLETECGGDKLAGSDSWDNSSRVSNLALKAGLSTEADLGRGQDLVVTLEVDGERGGLVLWV